MQILYGILNTIFLFFYDLLKPFLGEKGITTALTIVLFVIVIKIILIPLNTKMIINSIKMGRLTPKIEKIKAKYASNPEKMNAETMKLYQDEGINPMAGCLPMLIQWPILAAMFFVLQPQNQPLAELLDRSFLFINNFGATHNVVLAVLAGGTSFIQSYMTQKQQGASAGNQGNIMNIVMSGMMFYFGYITPSAVALYYVVSNIFQWIFMSIIRKIVINKEEAIEAESEKNQPSKQKVTITTKKIKNKPQK